MRILESYRDYQNYYINNDYRIGILYVLCSRCPLTDFDVATQIWYEEKMSHRFYIDKRMQLSSVMWQFYRGV